MILQAGRHRIAFPRRPLIMGIVNVNDDSFSGDGTLNFEKARGLAARAVADGADIIDVGAESARTNRGPVSVEEEVDRLKGFLEGWEAHCQTLRPKDETQLWPPLLSINTWRPDVVRQILPVGVDLLNDMSALGTPENAELCAPTDTALLIMHSIGQPKEPHLDQHYEKVMHDLDRFFSDKLSVAKKAGLPVERIVLDPGIDFAKQKEDNLLIYRHLDRLQAFERPLLLPVSRKTVIGEVLDLENPNDRDAGTVACLVSGFLRGAAIFRVHHVAAAWQTLKVLQAVETVEQPGIR
ncbi:MAG: dihydropteroate synthase [Verrucomicrobiota bacterium]